MSSTKNELRRAVAVWQQWLHTWLATHNPQALRTALACEQIVREKLAALRAELALERIASAARIPASYLPGVV